MALDLDAGVLRFACDDSQWTPAFPSAVTPGPAAGPDLFPALSGQYGARVQCNFGGDASRPLRLVPPSDEYRPFAEAAAAAHNDKARAPPSSETPLPIHLPS